MLSTHAVLNPSLGAYDGAMDLFAGIYVRDYEETKPGTSAS